jgi:hypothetical protein
VRRVLEIAKLMPKDAVFPKHNPPPFALFFLRVGRARKRVTAKYDDSKAHLPPSIHIAYRDMDWNNNQFEMQRCLFSKDCSCDLQSKDKCGTFLRWYFFF